MIVTSDAWLNALEPRYLADLRFAEVTRALRALSSSYVERRSGLANGAALDGAGKRAAFALYYGPLHYLVVGAIVRAIPDATAVRGTLVDLGCGTGTSGAAWAGACLQPPTLLGVDRHPWAAAEAAWTYRALGLPGRTRHADLGREALPRGDAFLAAFTLNELPPPTVERLRTAFIERSGRGASMLVVEPIARFVTPWWDAWREDIVAAGGRADEWRFDIEPPALVAKLARAAGLRLKALTARSLWIPGRVDGERRGR